MGKYVASSSEVSVFCDGVAAMLSAGIQVGEAVSILTDDVTEGNYKLVCQEVYDGLSAGMSLSDSMQMTGAFPEYAVKMVRMGEETGYLDDILRQLAVYYAEEDGMFQKISSNIGYPAALLLIMTAILGAIIAFVLPVFVRVYQNYAGSLANGNGDVVNAAMGIGWFALIITGVFAVLAVAAAIMIRSVGGRKRVLSVLSKLPFTSKPMHDLAISRVISAIGIFETAGMHPHGALREVHDLVDDASIKQQLRIALDELNDTDQAVSLAVALRNIGFIDPVHARVLLVNSRAGITGDTMSRISVSMFNRAISKLDNVIDMIEPALAAFLTVAVGLSLLSIMLPLIGIMGSIG